jgi:hypothetical protein
MFKLLFLVLALSSASAFAYDQIDIKGFHLGMRDKAFLDHVGDFRILQHYAPWVHNTKPSLTIGGTTITHIPQHGCKVQAGCSLLLTGEVDWFSFKLNDGQFEAVKAAVLEKYPGTVCMVDSCVYQTATEKLTLTVNSIQVEASVASVQSMVTQSEAKKDL